MKNAKHQWRVRVVPPVLAICRMCKIERVCTAFDHDLRGHICGDDFAFVRNAEDALAVAHLEQPTDSILDNPQ